MRKHITLVLVASLLTTPSITYSADIKAGLEDAPELKNVELSQDGLLEGQLLDNLGKPLANSAVVAHSQKDVEKAALTLNTDANGHFAIAGLKNGVCVLTVGKETFACRVWQNNTAPPESLTSVVIVREAEVTRGQNGFFWRLRNRLAALTPRQKAILCLLIAAAIIIPIAIDDDDNNNAS